MYTLYTLEGDQMQTFNEGKISVGFENTKIIVINDSTDSTKDANRIFFDASRYQNCTNIPELTLPDTDVVSEIWLSTIFNTSNKAHEFIITAFTNTGATPSLVLRDDGTAFTVDNVYTYCLERGGIPTFVKQPYAAITSIGYDKQMRPGTLRGFDMSSLSSVFDEHYQNSGWHVNIACEGYSDSHKVTVRIEDTGNFLLDSFSAGLFTFSWQDNSIEEQIAATCEDNKLAIQTCNDKINQVIGTQQSLFITR